MTLKEFMTVGGSAHVELYNGRDGKLVAKTVNSLKKYETVTVLAVYPKIKTLSDGRTSYTYFYAYGRAADIDRIKKEEQK